MNKIAIIIIVILVIFLIYILIMNDNDDRKIHKYSHLKSKLKTGDVLLFSCKKHSTLLNKMKYYIRTNLLGSEFGHVGIVIRDKNKLYLIECTDVIHTGNRMAKRLNDYEKGGIRIVDLDYLLKRYHEKYGGIFGVRFISKEISNDIILNKLNQFKEKIFENRAKLILLGFVDICISHHIASYLCNFLSNYQKIMCSQFAHQLLYQCNAVNEYKSELFWPHLFDDNKVFDKIQKIPYSNLYKFTYDE